MIFSVSTRRRVAGLCALVFAIAAHASIDAALQMQTGNPSNATADATNRTHYLIQRAQYALDYNDTTREANWVAWDLTSADSGSAARSDVFFQDTTLPAGFYQVRNTDYSGSGYDRGHMTPSADRTATRADNDATFYMSNMVPQSPDNNQGVWASFETYCRSLAFAGNELLLLSGPSVFGGSKIASGVAIPGYTWKIAVVVPLGSGTALSRITPATRVIAIKIPNIAGVRNNPWQHYITSVAQIETDTGLVFFTALSSSLAATLRTKVDGQSAAGAPTITKQPAAATATNGGSASFTVVATGTPTPTYQWRRNGTAIVGATAATYTIAGAALTDAGNYSVVVTNSAGAVTSASATLRVTLRNYAGGYFGTIGALGTFALHVRDDNTGVFLGFLTGSRTPCRARDLTLDENSRFTFTADPGFNFDCTIDPNGAVIGTLGGAATATLAATRSVAGTTSALAGVYQASVAGSSATVFVIVSPAGQAFALTQTAAGSDAGSGTIDSSGRIAITTVANQTVAGAVAADSSLSLAISAAGGQPSLFTGASDAIVAAQRFVNVSTRALSDKGAGATIAGFIINGLDAKPILLRAIGPGLAAYGVSGVLAKPRLQLYSGSVLVASNTGWATNPNVEEIASAAARVAAFPLSATSADSAMFVTLAPGSYTGVVTGADGGTGVVLVEVYDASAPSAGQKVVNISTRSQVGSADSVCIAGFVVMGSGPKRVLIRGVGPSLAQFGLAGVLAKPSLTLYRGSSIIAQNAGWAASADAEQITASAARVGAFAFNSHDEAALLLSLEPGGYTAVLAGANNTTGVGLVEVYEVP